MITESVLDFVFNVLSGFLNLLPQIDFEISASFFDTFLSFLSIFWYILPMKSCIIPIITIIVGINIFKIVISFLRTLWEILPIV